MHIPSHTLKPEIALATAAISIPFLAQALRKTLASSELRGKLPLVAAASAAILGMQAINVAVPGGTSAHLLGGALMMIGFGPWLGSLGMAAVFLAQAALLGDGGLDALGANWLNGAVAGPLLGWGIYRALSRENLSLARPAVAAFAGGFASLLAGAALCSIELSLSGHGDLATIAAAMVGGSAAWASLEGLLSAAVLLALATKTARELTPRAAAASLLALAAFAMAAQPAISSKQPDALENVLASSSAR